MANIEISSAMAGWFSSLARQNNTSLSAMCEDALSFYRQSYKALGLNEPQGGRDNGPPQDNRATGDKEAAVIALVERLSARLDFVGLRYLYNKAMEQAGIGNDMPERRDIVSRLINDGRLVTYKVENKEEGGDDVTAVELPTDIAPDDAD